ncbi:hypothetical protein BpHYR1_017641 [Brachionus plicatilis]|uniref:Uncharacterized protein n=1 Tax=Brachionus plicatilis TaxID=10195 RepID=A0A3M7SDT1_BRAPC|nr:hypothetical protein BpHYR1_017641 [Brachionus plicatilis]
MYTINYILPKSLIQIRKIFNLSFYLSKYAPKKSFNFLDRGQKLFDIFLRRIISIISLKFQDLNLRFELNFIVWLLLRLRYLFHRLRLDLRLVTFKQFYRKSSITCQIEILIMHFMKNFAFFI